MYNKFEQNKAFSIVKKALNYLKPKYLAVCILLSLTFATVQSVYSAVGIRETINFQGKLVNSAGLNVADGSYSVVFSLYTVSSGGTNIWQETQNVSTVDGLFRVELGSVSSLSSVNFNDDSLYLGIKVGADAEMTPRVRYTATPYAFQAKNVSWSGLQSPNANASLGMAAYTTSLLYSGTSGSNDLFVLSSSANSTGTGRLMSLRTAADSEISPFHVSAKGIEALFVSNLGRVGIGTTSPGAALQVVGAITASGIISGTGSGLTNLNASNITSGTIPMASVVNISGTAPNANILTTTRTIWGQNFNGSANVTGALTGVTDITASGIISGTTFRSALGSLGTPSYSFTGDDNTGIFSPGADILGFVTSGTERMRITSGGNVGIGTANPGGILDVTGTSSITNDNFKGIWARPVQSSANSGALYSIYSTPQYSASAGNTLNRLHGVLSTPANVNTGTITNAFGLFSRIDNISTGTITNSYGLYLGAPLFNNGTMTNKFALVTEANAGNVGIGTTNPALAKLEIWGTKISPDSYNYGMLNIHDTTASAAGVGGAISFSGYMDAIPNQVMGGSINLYKVNSTSGHSGFGLKFYTKTNNLNPSARVTIDDIGNVGIGTTSPTEQLEVSQNILIKGSLASGIKIDGSLIQRQTAGNALRFGVADVEVMRIQNGSIGIGTVSPTIARLQVVGDSTTNKSISSFGQGNGGSYDATISSGFVAGVAVQPFLNVTGNSSNVFGSYHFAGANVNTGFTLTNLHGLYVDTPTKTGSGTITNAYGLYVATPTIGTNNVAAYFGGNVGIGTASPVSKLSVTDETTIANRGITISQNTTDAAAALFNFRKSRGTAVSPTTVSNGDYTAAISTQNYDGSNYLFNGALGYRVNGTVTTNNVPSQWFFAASATTDNDPFANNTVRMVINSNGNVGIGTTNPSYKTEVAGANTGFWNGSTFTSTPMAMAISNTQPGGYDPVLMLQQTDSGGTIKNAGGIGLVGASNWAAGNNANQISNMYFLVRNNSGTISERMRITHDGNVGIGTASPGTKLEISDAANSVPFQIKTNAQVVSQIVSNNVTGDGEIRLWSNTNTGTYGQKVLLNTSGNSYLNGGNVGIGTASPNHKLVVEDNLNGANVFRIRNLNTGNTASSILRIGNNTLENMFDASAWSSGFTETPIRKQNGVSLVANGGGGLTLSASDANGTIRLFTGGENATNQRMTILSNGNVGIGTTNPGSQLTIVSPWTTTNGSGNPFFSISGNNNSNSSFVGGAQISPTIGTLGTNNLNLTAVEISPTFFANNSTNISNAYSLRVSATKSGGQTITNAYSLYVDAPTGATNNYAAYFGGNVGIGTTSPGYKLDVSGDVNITGSYRINGVAQSGSSKWTSGTGDNIYRSTGNVGIGTASPQASLQVAGPATGTGITLNVGGGGDTVLAPGGSLFFDGNYHYASGNYIRPIAANTQAFVTSGTERMRITSNGNVGIGTVSPVGKLHIGATTGVVSPGSIALSIRDASSPTFGFDFNLEGVSTGDLSLMRTVLGTQSQVMTFQRSSGNVGIGTTSPGGKLEVFNNVNDSHFMHINNPNASAQASSSIAFSAGSTIGEVVVTNQNYNYSINYGTEANTLQLINRGAGPLIFKTAGYLANAERMRITSNGNVGIGTTSPGTIFNVGGTTNKSISVDSSSNRAYYGAYNDAAVLGVNRDPATGSFFSTSKAASYIAMSGGASNGYIDFFATNVNNSNPPVIMRVAGNGNVGIGTVSPSSQLDIFGTTAGLQLSYDANDYGRFTVASDGALTLSGVSGGGALTNIARYSTSQINMDVPTSFNSAGDVSMAYDLYLSNQTASAIKSDGPLTIQSGEAFENLNLTLKASGQGNLIVQSKNIWADGTNVGIGTTNPIWTLDLYKPGDGTRIHLGSDAPGKTNTYLYTSSDTNGYFGIQHVKTAGSAYGDIVLNPDGGNVGIGTANPALAKLEIWGTKISPDSYNYGMLNIHDTTASAAGVGGAISFSGYMDAIPNQVMGGSINLYKVNSTSGHSGFGLKFYTKTNNLNPSARVTIDDIGNVGIGTTNPTSQLTINSSFATISGLTISGENAYDSQIITRRAASKTAFSVLAWESQVYLGAGIYYDNGVWVHHNSNNNNQLFTLAPGNGARWHASNNALSSWNQAIDVTLWDDQGDWNSLVQSTRTGNSYFTGGNVGIGTTSPDKKLDIRDGDFRLSKTADALYNFDINWNYDGSNSLNLIAAGTTFLEYDTNNGFTSFRAGNVGIGTTSPEQLLHVASTSTYNALARIEATGSGQAGLVMVAGSGANSRASRIDFLNVPASATVPRWTILNDYNQIGTNDLSIVDASYARVFTILQGGNVGIGTASPGSKLDIVSGLAGENFMSRFQSTTAKTWDGTNNLESIRFDSTFTGQSGIWNAARLTWGFASSFSTNGARIGFDIINSSGSFSNAMIITGAGNVGIGTTSPARALHVQIGTDNPPVRFQDSSGYCEINPTTTTWSCTSDQRLKKDIQTLPTDENLSKLLQLNPVSFAWNTQTDDKKRYGLIAQEVEQYFPEFVNTDEKGMKSVSYGSFTTTLIAAIQEQQLQIEAQSSALQALDPKILDLENTLAQIELERVTAVSQEEGGTAFENLYSIVEDTVSRVVSLENSVAEILSRIDSLVAPQISASDSARIEDLSQRMSFVEAMFMGELATGLNSTASAQLAMSISENEIIFDRKVVAEGDLSVLGETNLGDVGVTGNITNNMLVINGFDESLATPGASLNTLAGALNIQSSGLNSINFVDGSLKMDTDGNFIIHKGNLEVSMGSVKGNDGIRGINVSVGQSQVEMRVNFKVKNDTENYAVGISPSWFTNFLVSGKDENGFTVKFSTPAPQGAKFDWIVIE